MTLTTEETGQIAPPPIDKEIKTKIEPSCRRCGGSLDKDGCCKKCGVCVLKGAK